MERKANANGVIPASSALALGAFLALAGPLHAQDSNAPGALPTAAGANRTSQGGLSSAPASLPGAPGSSPLEPYLVTWLLPVSGIITVMMGIYTDRLLRKRRFHS